MAGRYRSYTSGRTITFTIPASSSSSTKTNPLAVSGRWRATTRPATSTVVACSRPESASLCITPGGSVPLSSDSGWPPGANPRTAYSASSRSSAARPPKRSRSWGWWRASRRWRRALGGLVEGERERRAGAGARPRSRLGGHPRPPLPQQLAPGEPQAVAPAHPHEVLDRRALELRGRPARQVADARERPAPLPLEHEFGRRLLAPVPHEPEPDSHGISSPLSRRERGTGGEDRAPHITLIHIWQQNLDIIAFRVPSQCVE